MKTIASLNEKMWYRFVKVCYFLVYFLVSVVITVMIWSGYEEDFKVFSSSQIEDITSVVHNLTGFTGSLHKRTSSIFDEMHFVPKAYAMLTNEEIELAKKVKAQGGSKEDAMEIIAQYRKQKTAPTEEIKKYIFSQFEIFINSDQHSSDYITLRSLLLNPIGHEEASPSYYDRMVADGVWKPVGSYEPESFDFKTIGKFLGIVFIALFVQFLVFEIIRRVFYYIVLGNFYPNS